MQIIFLGRFDKKRRKIVRTQAGRKTAQNGTKGAKKVQSGGKRTGNQNEV